jgi:hypothetical protein
VKHVAEPDRVRANTHPEVNARLDWLSEHRIRDAAARGDAAERIAALGREWDIERILETEMAVTGLAGLGLGIAVNRKFLILPGFAAAMMLLHAVQGWYPLLPLLRRVGARSQDEIERERYALKALRGDFDQLRTAESDRRAELAWRAVND